MAQDTNRGKVAVASLAAKRVEARRRGEKPLCGSPLVGSKDPNNPNHGKTCKRPAGAGTDHPGYGGCSMHTGRMRSAKISAAREKAVEQVEEFKRDALFYGAGDRAEVSFEEALLEELQRSVAVVRWIESKLATWGELDAYKALNTTDLPALLGEYRTSRSVTIADTEYAAWLRQYQLERRHLADVAKTGIASGIAKELVILKQRDADRMYRILVVALTRMGIQDGDDRVAVALPAAIAEVTGKAS